MKKKRRTPGRLRSGAAKGGGPKPSRPRRPGYSEDIPTEVGPSIEGEGGPVAGERGPAST